MSIATQPNTDVQLSDSQRRTLCRVLFIALCAIPTLWIAYLLLHPETPAQWSQRLQSQTGLVTTVDDVETPGPRWRVLRGVTFSDPEIGKLLEAAEVEIVYGDKINHIMVKNQSVQISSRALKHITDSFAKNVLQTGPVQRQWQIHIDKAVVNSHIVNGEFRESMVVSPLSIVVANNTDSASTVAHMQFGMSGDPEAKQINCQMIKFHSPQADRDLAGVDTEMWINTGKATLPVWLAWELSPDLERLGTHCEFAGVVHRKVLESSPVSLGFTQKSPAIARASGQFQHLDLAALVKSTGHTLTGDCRATVHELVLEDNQIKRLNFNARCERGTVAGELLSAMGDRGLSIYTTQKFQPSEMDFRSLNFNCQLNEGHFKISNPGLPYNGGDCLVFDSANQPMLVANSDMANSLNDLANVLFQPLNDPSLISQEKKTLLAKFQLPSTHKLPTRVSERARDLR